ncbi:MAG: HD domain-containing protein [Candidatus Hecatellaceae archaeon]
MQDLEAREKKTIRRLVRKRMKALDLAHNFSHVECVVRLTRKIGRAEKANLRIAVPAAYFHDLPPKEAEGKFSYSTLDSAREAESFLRKIEFPQNHIRRIRQAIIPASYSMHLKGVEPETLEAKVIRDADFLDAIGARGIARAFATAGYYGVKRLGKVRWNPEKPVRLPASKGPETPIHHFFSKLLHLKELMQTPTGRKLAEERHQYIVEYLKRFKAETSLKV